MNRESRIMRIGLLTATVVLSVAACGGASDGEPAATSTAALQPTTLASAPTASGDRDRFITALGGSLSGMDNETAVSMGMRACSAFSEKSTAADIRGVLRAKGLTAAQATRVVLAAVTAYCPQYADQAMG